LNRLAPRIALALGFATTLAHSQNLPRWENTPLTDVYAVASAGRDGAQVALRSDKPAARAAQPGAAFEDFLLGGEPPTWAAGSLTDGKVVYATTNRTTYTDGTAPPKALYQSRDGGVTWAVIPIALEGPEGHRFASFAPGPGDVVWAVRSGDYGLGRDTDAMLSIDGGRTWTVADTGLEGEDRTLLPAASDRNVAYAVTNTGLFVTTDQGAHWTKFLAREVLAPNLRERFVPEVLVDRVDARVVYVRTEDGTLRVTEDGGTTFHVVHGAQPTEYVGGISYLTADPADRGRIYGTNARGQIFESRDAGRTWHGIAPERGVPTRYNLSLLRPVVQVAANGDRIITSQHGAWRTRVPAGSFYLGSAMWWNPAESGMGLSITQHASGQVFVAWYVYGAEGSPHWYVMPGGTWRDGTTIEGTLYTARGSLPGAGYDPSRFATTPVGSASFTFDGDGKAVFSYRFDDGRQGTKAIERQMFGTTGMFNQLVDYSDLWWNAEQPGWGFSISEQRGRVFATWFTYDAQGQPTWVFMPDAVVEYPIGAPVKAVGDVYAARGSPLGAPFDPARFAASRVGYARIEFPPAFGSDRGAARLAITAFGRDEQIDLVRQPF
jgi:photosystem II stability/assembly factor-like uncharacterized protein